ncbi:hypothetical protein [Sabulicella rubraurantiaca]|uniref:hypothetical protein n=1 Tax=Sabulicella rubraurantiaca TaxID=2811429 RepID=UPI001A957481|nr:hypothetical protein [Sabulicella rubraurantiaca]
MATIRAGSGFALDFRDLRISDWYYGLTLTTSSSNYAAGDYRNFGNPQGRTEFYGFGFTYDALGYPNGGTLTGFQETNGGALALRADGFSGAVTQFLSWSLFGQTETALSTMMSGNDTLFGSPLADFVRGYGGNDSFSMGAGNDVVTGGLGNDTIHGERGVDTAVFNGLRSQYTVQYAGHGNRYTVSGPDGTDLLTSVERLRFSDGDRWVEDAAGQSNVVNRFLNTSNGTHFYTASNFEAGSVRTNLAHFENEGLAFKVAPVGASNTTDVYRFFNPQKGSHLYTTSTVERDHILTHLPNYRYENVAYKAYATDLGPQEELYRFYSKRTDTHFFTTSEIERDHVMSSLPDYVYEGISFYVDPI